MGLQAAGASAPLAFALTHRLTAQRQHARPVNDSIQNGADDGQITKQVVAFLCRELAGQQPRTIHRLLINHFQQRWPKVLLDPTDSINSLKAFNHLMARVQMRTLSQMM